jgi:uncharacterized sodium:solute symporter family permease YidK
MALTWGSLLAGCLALTSLPALVVVAIQRERQALTILAWAVAVAVALFLALVALGAYEAAMR